MNYPLLRILLSLKQCLYSENNKSTTTSYPVYYCKLSQVSILTYTRSSLLFASTKVSISVPSLVPSFNPYIFLIKFTIDYPKIEIFSAKYNSTSILDIDCQKIFHIVTIFSSSNSTVSLPIKQPSSFLSFIPRYISYVVTIIKAIIIHTIFSLFRKPLVHHHI